MSGMRAVLFDLDGTLLDTRDAWIAAFDASVAAIGRSTVPGSVAAQWIGTPIEVIYERAGFTQEEIACWAGVSVPALARSLRTLREAGVIRSARQRIVVLDERALRKIAQSGGIAVR